MKTTLGLYAILTLALLTIIGCGHFEAPTASQPTVNEETAMWSPQPGDQIDGHAIPLVNENYWESQFGASANPWLLAPRSVVIGAMGGIVTFGPHTLIVPAGAVDGNITITMSNASSTAIAVDCTPSPYHFNIPVTLILSYRGTQYQTLSTTDNTLNALRVYYMTPDGDLEPQRCTVNPFTSTVSAEVDHFSRYILG